MRWIAALAAVLSMRPAHAAIDSIAAPAIADRQRGCPYDFRSDIPSGDFCVYRGTVFTPDGAICSDDAVVIWHTQHRPEPPRSARRDGVGERDVFLGFAHDPSLLIRGLVRSRTRARLTDFALGAAAARAPLDGATMLGRRLSGHDAMTIRLRDAIEFAVGDTRCDFGSYHGVFIGMMRRSPTEDDAATD
jgi:hypothetical protein